MDRDLLEEQGCFRWTRWSVDPQSGRLASGDCIAFRGGASRCGMNMEKDLGLVVEFFFGSCLLVGVNGSVDGGEVVFQIGIQTRFARVLVILAIL